MKSLRVLAVALPFWLVAMGTFAKELKTPVPSPSDALFDPSRVVQIEIRLDPKDWHALRISHPIYGENHRVAARGYEYYRGDVTIDGKLVKSAGVRKKGTGSEVTTRPAFKIKFDKYVKGQKFSGLEVLTLNNLPYQADKAMQSLAYSFLNRAGVVSPRSNLARIVVNGEDLGIYGHVESIDKPFIKRHFGNSKGDLYEGQFGADFTTNEFKHLIHKWGPDDDFTAVRELVDLLEGADPVPLQRLAAIVDLDAFLTFWAATVLVGHVDCYPYNANNYYFYRDAVLGKFVFIPWGADVAFERAARQDVPTSVWANGQLCRRLWELPEIRERYRNEMRRLLAGAWNEKSMLEELEQIRRWRELIEPERMATPFVGVTGPEGFANLAKRISHRRKEVQNELDRPAPDWPPPLAAPAVTATHADHPPMLVEGAFSAVVRDAFPTNTTGYFGMGAATIQSTVAGEIRQPFTHAGAVAVMRKQFDFVNTIQIVVADAAGGLSWQITFRMDPYRAPLQAGTRQLGGWSGVRGSVELAGAPKRQSRAGQHGSLELTQVSTNLGGVISGTFKLNTTAFEERKQP